MFKKGEVYKNVSCPCFRILLNLNVFYSSQEKLIVYLFIYSILIRADAPIMSHVWEFCLAQEFNSNWYVKFLKRLYFLLCFLIVLNLAKHFL